MRRFRCVVCWAAVVWLGVLVCACGGGRGSGRAGSEPAVGGEGAVRVVEVPMEGIVGVTLRAEDLREVLPLVDAALAAGGGEGGAEGGGDGGGADGDAEGPVGGEASAVIVVTLASDGGMLRHVGPLVAFVEDALASRGLVVARVERAISAAALVGLGFERVVFDPGGVMGAAWAVDGGVGAERRALGESEVALALGVGAEAARRGGHPAAVARAMQVPVGLWVAGDGRVGVGEAPPGAEPVAEEGGFLVLNAVTAARVGVSRGTARDAVGAARVAAGDGGVSGRFELAAGAGEIRSALDRARASRAAGLERVGAAWRRASAAVDAAEAGRAGASAVAASAIEALAGVAAEEAVAARYLGVDSAALERLRLRLDAARTGG